MAHELAFDRLTGIAQMFSVREVPWHKEGHLLLEAPSREEALRLAGHDFFVIKRPTFRAVAWDATGAPTDFLENDSAFVTVRTDTGEELGSVGPAYVPIQNDVAFQVLDPLLDSGLAHLITGGTLRQGADCWLQVAWNIDKFGPIVREVFADEVIPFALVANNHDGRRGVMLRLTPIRVVCANTLGMAEGSARGQADDDEKRIVIAHTGDAPGKVVDAATKLFGGLVERYEVVATQYKLLKETFLAAEVFDKIVLDKIEPLPKDRKGWNPEAKMAAAVTERVERKRTELRRMWHEGTGHSGDSSAWEAYNGVVEVMDYNTDLYPNRAGVYRTASLMTGVLAKHKRTALHSLVAYAKGAEVDDIIGDEAAESDTTDL